jgi:transcriptional activator protein UGA3
MELASCLVHCSMESISGDTTHWFGHHVGAYEVIRSTSTISGQGSIDLAPFRRTFEGRWLLRSFAYHDIMMAAVEDRRPLLVAGEYWAFPENSVDSYFGLASRIMYLISEISILNVNIVDPNAEAWYTDERFSSVAY